MLQRFLRCYTVCTTATLSNAECMHARCSLLIHVSCRVASEASEQCLFPEKSVICMGLHHMQALRKALTQAYLEHAVQGPWERFVQGAALSGGGHGSRPEEGEKGVMEHWVPEMFRHGEHSTRADGQVLHLCHASLHTSSGETCNQQIRTRAVCGYLAEVSVCTLCLAYNASPAGRKATR